MGNSVSSTYKRLFRNERAFRGFTLVELGLVLAVISILAAVVVPDFIEVTRNDLAEKAAVDVNTIFDTAKWHFSQEASAGGWNPDAGDWPSEACLTGGGTCPPMLSASALVNPWGRPYVVGVQNVGPSDFFTITTAVPESVTNVFKAYVPGGSCRGDPGHYVGWCNDAAPTGYETCCGMVPRPGQEAAYQGMLGELQENMTVGFDDCRQVDQGTLCDEGEMVRGVTCTGKNCGSPMIECCSQGGAGPGGNPGGNPGGEPGGNPGNPYK